MATDIATKIMRLISRAALSHARAAIPSKTLRRAARIVDKSKGQTGPVRNSAIFIPHYWAVMVHDGHKAIGFSDRRMMIWFRNPSQDPRFPGKNQPVRYRERLTLTKSEFKYWQQRNAKIKDPRKRPMIVSYKKKAVAASPFFLNEPGGGMAGLRAEVDPLIREMVRKELGDLIGPMSARESGTSVAKASL